MKLTRIIFSLIFFFSLTTPSLAGNILFDTSHRVIFHPTSDKPLGLKGFTEIFKRMGDKVLIGNKTLKADSLKGVDVLVLPGSMTSYDKSEIDIIEDYVNNGGSLLVLLHIAPPLARVTERFGIVLSNMVISEKNNLIDKSSQDFYSRDIRVHPVTEGVKEIALYGTWGLLAEKGASILAATTPDAWGDANRNRVYDVNEPMAVIGVVAAAESGRGRIIVVADDAPLANAFLDMGDNRRLATNIASWLR